MEAGSHKTILKDRVLWYDGDSTVPENEIVRQLSLGIPVDGVFVEEITAEIRRYNALVPPDQQIRVKTEAGPLNFDWNIPEEYKTLDVVEYLQDALDENTAGMTDLEWQVRAERVARELSLYHKLGLGAILRALIYIINTLHTNNVVWGVGRGSGVSSYVLYLIGVHDVDSVTYDLDITDFLRTE